MMAKQVQIETEGIGLGILIFLGILISWFFSMKQLLRIVNARRMAKRSDDEFEQSTTFIWTGDGIVLATPTGGVLLPWRGIYKATETKLTVRLERRDFYYSFIPKRIFEENEIQMFDFIESVNECVANVVESPNLEGEYTERGNPYDSSGGLN